MAAQAGARGEAELTDQTAVGLFTSVDHLVVQQASGVSESLRAGRASVGSFTSV